jgi:hypothetical protein
LVLINAQHRELGSGTLSEHDGSVSGGERMRAELLPVLQGDG